MQLSHGLSHTVTSSAAAGTGETAVDIEDASGPPACPATGGVLVDEVQPSDTRAFSLLDSLQASAAFDTTARERLWIATYFLSPVRAPVCPFARHVEIPMELQDWREVVIQQWQGLLDPNAVASVYVVQPGPPQNTDSRLVAAYVLLVQHERPEQVAALFTRAEQGELSHVTVLCPRSSTKREIFHAAGLSDRCLTARPTVWCIARRQTLQFGYEPVELVNGDNIVLSLWPLTDQEQVDFAEALRTERARVGADFSRSQPPRGPPSTSAASSTSAAGNPTAGDVYVQGTAHALLDSDALPVTISLVTHRLTLGQFLIFINV